MLCFKKSYRDELIQLALVLSILRLHEDSFYDNDLFNTVNLDYDNGTIWQRITPGILRTNYVNPKSLDSVLMNYERELFEDLNSLGRFTRTNYRYPDVTTYLLNIERNAPGSEQANLTLTNQQQNQSEEVLNNTEAAGNSIDGLNLTQEDMDLIEVLWKQDVDLGFSLENAAPKTEKLEIDKKDPDATEKSEEVDKLKTLQTLNEDSIKQEPFESDPWAGLNYTIDTETGEYVVKGEVDDELTGRECSSPCDLPLSDLPLPLPEFFLNDSLQLDEAFRFADLEDEASQETALNLKELENLSLSTNASLTNSVDVAGTDASVSLSKPEATKGSDVTSPPKDPNISSKDGDQELDFLTEMMTTQFHHPHHRGAFHQTRGMPFVRAVSMEQRWQDLASLLSLPSADGSNIHHHFGHHHPLHNYTHPHTMGYSADGTRGVLLHNASLAPPLGDLNSSVPLGNLGGTNIGSAVATSINLTNSSEPMGEASAAPHYKMEPSQDIYYQNNTEMNQTDSGFLSSILNDEDLQLMDMAMNEGIYTMRMLDGNSTLGNLTNNGTTALARHDMERLDSSSDSAVSSMGSERVPSLSDGEWGDGGSDSGHTTTENYVGDNPSKMRPYDYSYTSRHLSNDSSRMPPVAQKKHQMYGKRYFQDHNSTSSSLPPTELKYEYRDHNAASYNISSQSEGAIGPKVGEVKYSCSVEFGLQNHLSRSSVEHIHHNHSYHLPAESSGSIQRPISRDKVKIRKSDEEHLTRDEKRARALNVPISVDDIINLPMDEFNERLSKYDLSESQLSLIRDIRRRGKNKVAAQNCRKRKLDQILTLADEVKEMRDKKIRLINDHDFAKTECRRMKDKYQQLYRHIFQNLRDPDGNQYSPYQYTLQTSADGSVLMVPRTNCTNSEQKDTPNRE